MYVRTYRHGDMYKIKTTVGFSLLAATEFPASTVHLAKADKFFAETLKWFPILLRHADCLLVPLHSHMLLLDSFRQCVPDRSFSKSKTPWIYFTKVIVHIEDSAHWLYATTSCLATCAVVDVSFLTKCRTFHSRLILLIQSIPITTITRTLAFQLQTDPQTARQLRIGHTYCSVC